ncbi:cupredoxin domain-containing protein [Corynebacterium kutscheri]|uniref:cupredoxin domain-containing protein n=1 Tax=Corynebacterium kutscheri TaxID=35755 RepID=UPI0037BEE024
MTPSTFDAQDTSARPTRLQRHAWHRKASKPVTYWMMTLVLVSLFHWRLPDYRWILIHIFTLGILTNSIMLWSQHFTEKFLHAPLAEHTRIWQLRRFWILNFGIIAVITGQALKEIVTWHWWITCTGAFIVGASLTFHAYYVARQLLQAKRGQRYEASVLAYVCSAACLPIGALGGGLMSAELSSPWQERVLLAHLILNIGGFVGLASMGTLMLLFPAIWRTQAKIEHNCIVLALMMLGLIIATSGALIDEPTLLAAGIFLYIAGIIDATYNWYRCVITVLSNPRDRITFAAVSVAMAPLWLIGALGTLGVRALQTDTIIDITLPTMALLIGFAGQLLIGVMSYLLPSNIGGGPQAVRTGMLIYDTAGLFRSTMLNVGLCIWLYTEHSLLRIVTSLLCLGSLAIFLVLTPIAVRNQLGVIRRQHEARPVPDKPKWNQINAAIAILAFIIACAGGLHHNSRASSPALPTAAADKITTLEITAQGTHFLPDEVQVPQGNELHVVLINDDTKAHDIRFENGVQSGRVLPGKRVKINAGIIENDQLAWCTIAGHRAQGMEMKIIATNAAEITTANPTPTATTAETTSATPTTSPAIPSETIVITLPTPAPRR